ncbi:hypothetical protein J6590_072694 [Homalodisca vitripennis]|nr:hypothetical protein J6590_072694 [Homalodisca vitripennis]
MNKPYVTWKSFDDPYVTVHINPVNLIDRTGEVIGSVPDGGERDGGSELNLEGKNNTVDSVHGIIYYKSGAHHEGQLSGRVGKPWKRSVTTHDGGVAGGKSSSPGPQRSQTAQSVPSAATTNNNSYINKHINEPGRTGLKT